MNAHAFQFTDIDGRPLNLSQYKGQLLLVVNTASRCAFTLQYGPLRDLYTRYATRGLSILGVPSNDFGQEPEGEAEVRRFCQEHYLLNFPLTAKTSVRGAKAHPFFVWARKEGGWLSAPKWNFHKYLIGRDGELLAWYFSSTSPLSKRLTRRIEQQLRLR